jgi:hypothetical protein
MEERMFNGLHSPGRTRIATGQERYGLRNKVHSKIVAGMGDASVPDYYGPTLPGQSWSQFESFMKMPVVSLGIGAVVGLINPLAGLAVGVGSWLLNADGSGHSNKPTSQGG